MDNICSGWVRLYGSHNRAGESDLFKRNNVGTADITGPVVETNMMGYANFAQTDSGLHMRQRSRVFIVASASSPSDRILLINAGNDSNGQHSLDIQNAETPW